MWDGKVRLTTDRPEKYGPTKINGKVQAMNKPAGPVTDEQAAEVDALTMEERETYWEAVRCGATHNDAMEAANTHGYTR